MGNKRARVYSYLRFSDSRQATGSSADRQQEYARRWAADHNLELDAELSMRDEGLSAYHQAHVKQGALGVFLAAVDAGRIAPGSVLVVEGLDRLSRAEPIQAQAQLAQIINAGITVVTASDGKSYSRSTLKASPMDLVYSLLVMIRAHEESDTKSQRVRAALRRRCEQWQAGTNRAPIRAGRDPHWLEWDGDAWVIVPEIAEGVLAAVELHEQGLGAARIMQELGRRGLRVTRSAGAAGSQLYKMFYLPALVGDKLVSVDGEEYRLAGYYPALMSRERFDALQLRLSKRGQIKGRSEIPGIITGMGIARCGYCGSSLGAQNMTFRARADGSLADGHRRLICTKYSHSRACQAGSFSAPVLERTLMRYCADQMNLSSLLQGTDRSAGLRSEVAKAAAAVAATEQQLERVTNALLADDGPAPLAFVRKARSLEESLQTQRSELARAERELASVASVKQPALAEAWAELAAGVDALNTEARIKARRLVQDTFEKIVVYAKGLQCDDNRIVDMMLVPKGGRPRLLRINRRTGEWVEGLEA